MIKLYFKSQTKWSKPTDPNLVTHFTIVSSYPEVSIEGLPLCFLKNMVHQIKRLNLTYTIGSEPTCDACNTAESWLGVDCINVTGAVVVHI